MTARSSRARARLGSEARVRRLSSELSAWWRTAERARLATEARSRGWV